MALYPEGSYELVPNDGMRKVVAARLTESKQTVPHFYLTLDCKIDALLEAREQINAAAPQIKDGKPDYKLSVNDFVMKAWAAALMKVPTANATWAGDAILYHKHADVAVAVVGARRSLHPRGEVLRHQVAAPDLRRGEGPRRPAPAARSSPRTNTRAAPRRSATSACSASRTSQAVINPPHGTILAVGAGEERVYVDKGQIKTGNFMTVTLSVDHRAVDGALGAELLAAFKGLIETPVMMLA